jgi:hypothetical protein
VSCFDGRTFVLAGALIRNMFQPKKDKRMRNFGTMNRVIWRFIHDN